MRARFKISAALAAAALAGGLALPGGVASASTDPGMGSADTTLSLVDVSVPGPVDGSKTCVTTTPGCISAPGIANLSVTASAVVNGPELPVITLANAPGCTGQINVGAVVTPGLASGIVTITIVYDLTDAKGAVIPDSQTTIIKSVPFSAGTPPVIVTECATVA
jgi:hypothetical protein